MKNKYMRQTMAFLLGASLVSGMCISSLAADNTASSETQETSSEQESTAHTPPEMPNGEKSDGQPPEMPNGEKPEGEPPEMLNGEKPDGQPPEMPNGQKPDGEPPAKPDGPGKMGERKPGGQERKEGQLGSWSMGGTDASSVEGDDYVYDSALYINSEGIDEEKSSTDRIEGGTYDDASAQGITISDDASGHNGILVDNAEYSITNAEIDLLTDADGTDTCDFSGKGTAVAAFGSDAEVTIEDSAVHNTSFTINEYYSIGQVANLVNDNGGNKVSIELNGDAVWNVTGTSLISSLSIEDDAQVVIPENITLTVDGTEYSGCTLTAEDI